MRPSIKMSKKKNLVIGLSGPYGSGCSSLAGDIENIIKNWPGCLVKPIHVADLIETYYTPITGEKLAISDTDLSEKRKALQAAGTELRKMDPELIGRLVSAEIHNHDDEITKNSKFDSIDVIVYVIDSLKNKYDLQLLQRTYLNEFYFVFNYADRETRWRRMVDYKSWDKNDRVKFEQRDAVDQNEKNETPGVKDRGQQVQKLASKADFYIVNNNNNNREKLSEDGKRLIRLLFGDVKNQPTVHERNMHIAYSASNASFCLSRQVGAAIVDSHGNLLSVGHNDVPKASGGLYSSEDDIDRRCYSVGDRSCINDVNKKERFKELSNAIAKKFDLNERKDEIAGILEDSSFSEVIEYCRAVHAEMDALLSVARAAKGRTFGATMYVTTELGW